jgi:hypothetical protein
MLVTCLALAGSLSLSTASAAPRTPHHTTPHGITPHGITPRSTIGGPRHVVADLSKTLKNYLPTNPKFSGHLAMRATTATNLFSQKGSKTLPGAQGAVGFLVYRGGPVLHNPAAVLIFWGPDWQTNATEALTQTVVTTFFEGIGHTSYENIASQYYDPAGPIANGLAVPLVLNDTSVPPHPDDLCYPATATVNYPDLEAEATAVEATYPLPSYAFENTTYFVFVESGFVVSVPAPGPPPGGLSCSVNPTGGSWCGAHGWDSSVHESYALMPYPDIVDGCWPSGVDPNGSPEGDALANISASTLMGSVTDPQGNAWSDFMYNEIGDMCNGDFSGAPNGYTLANNSGRFALQALWSNASPTGVNAFGQCVNSYAPDTVGAYIPGSPSYFCLRAKLTVGGCDIAVPFGVSGDIPIVGDWTEKGYDSIGVYIPGNPGYFCLHNSNTPGGCDIAIPFGVSGDIPVVGDWTGKGYDSIGVYIPSSGYFCLRNTNTSGSCDITLALGVSGDIPVVGDWTGEGFNTVGVWIPQYGFFCLRNTNTTGTCDIAANFGTSGDIPLDGDTGDQLNESTRLNIKLDTLGVWIASNGYYCLRNSNVTGPCDVATQFGSGSDIPLLGNWFDEGAGYEHE